MSQITYRGSKLFIRDRSIRRVNSLGYSTEFRNEDVFELGNKDRAGYVTEVPGGSITIDGYDYASMRTLNALLSINKNVIELGKDLDNKSCDIYVWYEMDDKQVFSRYFDSYYLTSMRYSYTVDGNFTESYNLEGNDSKIYYNDGKYIVPAIAKPDTVNNVYTYTSSSTGKVVDVLAVYHGGVKKPKSEWTSKITTGGTGSTVTITPTSGALWGDGLVVIRLAANEPRISDGTEGDANFVWDTEPTGAPAALRRGNIKVYITPGGVVGNKVELRGIQSLNIDCTINRDERRELGYSYVTERPIRYPIDISISVDITDEDFALMAKLAGVDMVDGAILNLAELNQKFGLYVELFKKSDLERDADAKADKILEIPEIVFRDESYNVSVDSNATQSLSFNSHNLIVRSV